MNCFLLKLLLNQLLTTIVSGVLVFVVCQLFIEYTLTPIKEYKQLKSKIAYHLVYYANLLHNPVQIDEDKDNLHKIGSEKMRVLAAEVAAFAESCPSINVFFPNRDKLRSVSSLLIGLSNSFFEPYRVRGGSTRNADEYERRIREILKLCIEK